MLDCLAVQSAGFRPSVLSFIDTLVFVFLHFPLSPRGRAALVFVGLSFLPKSYRGSCGVPARRCSASCLVRPGFLLVGDRARRSCIRLLFFGYFMPHALYVLFVGNVALRYFPSLCRLSPFRARLFSCVVSAYPRRGVSDSLCLCPSFICCLFPVACHLVSASGWPAAYVVSVNLRPVASGRFALLLLWLPSAPMNHSHAMLGR